MKFDLSNLRGDIYGGLTAGVVALPLALAFGEASGAGPMLRRSRRELWSGDRESCLARARIVSRSGPVVWQRWSLAPLDGP